jgi:Acetyltransferase (GNAT) domain/FemAB family
MTSSASFASLVPVSRWGGLSIGVPRAAGLVGSGHVSRHAASPNLPPVPAGLRAEVVPAPAPASLEAWDALVAATPGTDVNQLSAWARVRAVVGYAVTYVFVHDGDRLVGGAQVLHRRFGFGVILAYVPSGPVVAADVRDRAVVVGVLADALAALVNARRALFVQPPDGGDDVSDALSTLGFRPSEAGIAPAGTLRLDLARSEEDLRAGLGRRLRYWTNKWADRGVTVRRGDEADVGLLAELMQHSARHQGYDALPCMYVQSFYRELAPGGHAVLFVGEVHGRPVAADLLTGCGGILKGRLGGFDRSGDASKLSVPAAVRWEAIRWAKREGYRWFDFGGIDTGMLRDLMAGITNDEQWPSADRAKLSFGGSPYAYPPKVERIDSWAARLAYDAARRSRMGRRAIDAAEQRLRGARREDT